MKRTMVSRYIATGLVVMGVCLAIGCATTDTVTTRFSSLEENITAAKTAGAEVYAPIPLKAAEAKLEAAKAAVRAEDMVAAARLVDEAMVDADYARAKAPTEKAKKEALQLRAAIQTVRDEIRSMPVVNTRSIQ